MSFHGYDGHGSVRLLTDAMGAVTDAYTYDAFGNLLSQMGTTPNEHLYAGELLDANTGFYYLRFLRTDELKIMRILLSLTLFFLLMPLQAFAQEPVGAVGPVSARPSSANSSSASKEKSPDEELAGAERALAEAFRLHDEAALKSILADDFSYIRAPSETMTKAQFIASAAYFKINSFSFDDMMVRAFGSTLVLSATYRQTVSAVPADRTEEFFITDIWLRRNGRWQIAARYVSRQERNVSPASEPTKETPPPAPNTPKPRHAFVSSGQI